MSKGDRPVKISWNFHGLSEMKDLEIRTKRISERSSLLSIKVVTPDHSGNYTCTASNAAATTSYTATLTVNGILLKIQHHLPFSLSLLMLLMSEKLMHHLTKLTINTSTHPQSP